MSIPLSLVLVVCSLLPVQMLAYAENGEFDADSIVTSAYILIDADTGQVIASKNPDEKMYPASTTKVMTALLLLEAKENELDSEVTAGAEVNPFDASTSTLMKVKQNETITYKDVLYGMMLPSGNDAANMVAAALTDDHENYGEKFSEMMNNKASELGMSNSHFVNAHGLHDSQHYTTARDMSKLAMEAMKHPAFVEAVHTDKYTYKPTNADVEEREMFNTNLLLDNERNRERHEDLIYEYAIGIKTGLTVNITNDAGDAIKVNGCLVAAAKKDGRTLIAIMMGDNTEKTDTLPTAPMRFIEAKKLFEYGFEAQSKDISAQIKGVQLRTTLTGDANESTLAPILENGKAEFYGKDEDLLAKLDDAANIKAEIKLDEGLAPPYQVNQEVGTATYTVGEQTVYSCRVSVADTSLLPSSTADPNGAGTTGTTGGNGNTRVKNVSDNRNFMIALLSVALIMMLILFVRIMTAPRRRRRRRQLRRRYY